MRFTGRPLRVHAVCRVATLAAISGSIMAARVSAAPAVPKDAPSASAPAAGALEVRARRMVDVARGVLRENVVVRVQGSRIVAVDTTGRSSPQPGARVLDLGELTLVPGLIDSHVHLTLAGDPDSNAIATLRAGFTTVLDLGALGGANLALRRRIQSGATPGPRMLCAGAWRGAAGGTCDFGGIGVRGAEAFRARVREDVAAGADVIKVCVDGWPAMAFEHPDSVEIRADELAAVLEEAKAAGRPVFAHATSRAGVRLAVAAGVRAIAHSNFADSATVAEMIRRQVHVIPTLASFAGGRETTWGRALFAHMRGMLASGVPVAFGTDAGVLPHGMNAREFRPLVRSGLSPLAALRTATTGGAALLGLADRVGRIEPGMEADLVAVEGNPLDSVEVFSRVRLVIKGGVVVRDDRPRH